MKLSYKYRIYPNKDQAAKLQSNFAFCCFLYNSALQERNDFYKKYKKSVSYNSQSAQLPDIKDLFAEQTKSIYSQCFQQVLKRLDSAYKGFFRRVKSKSGKAGFPRFKSFDRFNSIVFPQSNLKGFGAKLQGNKLKLFGIPGEIKVKLHRPLQGRAKTVTIKKQGDKFYLIVSCDEVPLAPLASTGKNTAIDLGLNSFITSDDGTKFHHPKPYKTAKEKLAYLNQGLASKMRGSKNRMRAKQSLARAYEKVVNVRNDFLHKVSSKLIKDNDKIIIEKLNVKSMLEAKGFEVNKGNIQDASWGRFAAMLSYKAEKAGRKLIKVNPRNTSKMCSGCGKVKEILTLRDRIYNCDACGIAMDRDLNAAKNILRLGTSHVVRKVKQKPSASC